MEHEPLDDWIASLLPTHSLQQGFIDSVVTSFANRVEMME
jgi:hypothetical protein